jgi:ribosomal protein L40E
MAANVICPSCGFKNAEGAKRCVSCGAKTTQIGAVERTHAEKLERRYQQEGFSITWFFIAIGVQSILTAAVILGLPQVVAALDLEGYHGMMMAIGIWFLGGLLTGLISPGRTFSEPSIATFCVAIPTVIWLERTETVFTLPGFLYVVMGALGVLFSLIGSYFGERIQLGPPPKAEA